MVEYNSQLSPSEEIDLRKQIIELDNQITQLLYVIEKISQKISYIENETHKLHQDIINELKELKEEVAIEKR